jgi:hypothetical protein
MIKMPDLQTAMQKILQSWEQPEITEPTKKESTVFTPTTNTSRATFEIVRDDPGLPAMQYVRKLEARGYKKSSTTSLLAQMLRQGHIRKGGDGGLHPNQAEYRPLKSAKTYVKKAKKVKTSKLITSSLPQPSAKALAMAAEAMSGINMLGKRPYRTKIQTILDGISLSDAHELYRELHTYFGGLPR